MLMHDRRTHALPRPNSLSVKKISAHRDGYFHTQITQPEKRQHRDTLMHDRRTLALPRPNSLSDKKISAHRDGYFHTQITQPEEHQQDMCLRKHRNPDMQKRR